MKNIGIENIPTYTLRPSENGNHYVLTMGNNAKTMLLNGNFTSIVWYVTQEFHAHDFWEICLVLRGNSLQRFPNWSEPMKPGSVYILRPHDVHCITPLQPEMPENLQCSHYIHRDIYIPVEKMRHICDSLDKNLYAALFSRDEPLFTVLSADETDKIESSFNYFTMQNENFDFMHTVIVSHILCSVLENRRYAKTVYPAWLTQLLTDLDKEDYMVKDIREIVDSVGYDQSYLCRQFKKYTNQTLVEYIHKRKCSYSAFMLSHTEISVAQIAQRLQFADASTYIRIFKKINSVTPGQYRKRLLKLLRERESQGD